MTHYSALIVEDDLENCLRLEIYLKKYCKDINVLHKVTTVEEAIDKYLEFTPDILFLNIQLQELATSFTLLEKCNTAGSAIIFMSTNEEHALKAIEYNPTAYLLKPIESNIFVAAVQKAKLSVVVKNHYNQNSSNNEISNPNNSNFITIASLEKIEFIQIIDLVYLEADGRYTLFHLKNGKILISSKNIGEYVKILNNNIFFRIHYKYVVNLNMVANINKAAGNYCETLNGKRIPIAKRRQEELYKFLNLK